jgi:hypothetical protein
MPESSGREHNNVQRVFANRKLDYSRLGEAQIRSSSYES